MNAESLHKGWVALEVSARMGGRMCGVFLGCGDGLGLYHTDSTGDGDGTGLDCMETVLRHNALHQLSVNGDGEWTRTLLGTKKITTPNGFGI